jgi:hypothetical protein
MSLSRLAALRQSQATIVRDEATQSADAIKAEIERLQGLQASGALSQLQANHIKDSLPLLQRIQNMMVVVAADGAEKDEATEAPTAEAAVPFLHLRRRRSSGASA